jgi:hypothetical protein
VARLPGARPAGALQRRPRAADRLRAGRRLELRRLRAAGGGGGASRR